MKKSGILYTKIVQIVWIILPHQTKIQPSMMIQKAKSEILEKSFANVEWAIFTNLWKICQIESSLRFLHKRLQLVLDLEISDNELKSML